MAEPTILRVPYLGTAEDDVLLAEWFVAEGESFRKGQAVAAVETLKAAFEVEAEADGVLIRRIVEEGVRVPLQAALGIIATDAAVDDAALEAVLVAAASESPACTVVVEDERQDTVVPRAAASGAQQVAPAARRRARELGVDLAAIAGTGPGGLVRVEDVEGAAAAGPGLAATASDGRVDPEFVAHLRRDRRAFAALDSAFKLALYRRHGAKIGDGAVFAPGSVLIAEQVDVGPHFYLGAESSVEARRLHAGEYLHFGQRCRVRCTTMRFGDNAFLTDDIEIGGGGAWEPEAELVVGSHGFIGEHVHLNPCRRLELGDEVVLSRNAVVMTHSFGGSILRGMPNRFSGVTIGSYAQIGIQATLFPGVEVGEGAILLSGSSLVSSVPAGRMFGGVPAVDMKSAAQPLDDSFFARTARELVTEFARQLTLRRRDVTLDDAGGELSLRVAGERGGAVHLLRLAATRMDDFDGAVPAEDVRVLLHVDAATWAARPGDVAMIDLDGPESAVPRIAGPAGPLTDAFREFLRKRGVRLEPRSWAYKGGWL